MSTCFELSTFLCIVSTIFINYFLQLQFGHSGSKTLSTTLPPPPFHQISTLSLHSDTTTVCYRLRVQLARNFNDLNTALDMKNNLGRNVLALFDPPHLSKLGKFFITRICAKPKRDSVTRYSRKMCVRVVNGIVNSNNLKIWNHSI